MFLFASYGNFYKEPFSVDMFSHLGIGFWSQVLV